MGSVFSDLNTCGKQSDAKSSSSNGRNQPTSNLNPVLVDACEKSSNLTCYSCKQGAIHLTKRAICCMRPAYTCHCSEAPCNPATVNISSVVTTQPFTTNSCSANGFATSTALLPLDRANRETDRFVFTDSCVDRPVSSVTTSIQQVHNLCHLGGLHLPVSLNEVTTAHAQVTSPRKTSATLQRIAQLAMEYKALLDPSNMTGIYVTQLRKLLHTWTPDELHKLHLFWDSAVATQRLLEWSNDARPKAPCLLVRFSYLRRYSVACVISCMALFDIVFTHFISALSTFVL